MTETNVQTSKQERQASIELLRIVCIFMVIFNHTLNYFYNDGAGALFARYVNFFNICAVGTFLIITGFFLCNGDFNYGKKLKKLLFGILLPTLIVMTGIVLFHAIVSEDRFFPSLWEELKMLGKEILGWGFSDDYGYLWFILAYTEIIVLYPVFYLLCGSSRPAVIARRLVMALCFAGLVVGNVGHMFRLSFSIHVFSMIGPYMLFVLIGHELRLLFSEGISTRKAMIIGLAMYLGGVGMGMAFSSLDTYFYMEFSWYWYYLENFPAIISAIGLFCVFYPMKIRGNSFLYLVARSVFYVYLIQSPIHVIFQRLQLAARLFPYLHIVSYCVIFILVSVLSFSIGIAVELVIERVKKQEKQLHSA